MSGSGPGQSLARPRQVTVAGVMAAVACLLLVLSLFDSMAQIRSSDTDRMVRQFLSSAPGRSLGLDVEAVVQVMRAVVLLSGALAAAGVILSVYALRRHRGARVGLSVVAVLMLFSTTFVAGLLPLVVVLGAAMLWRREARDWFDGRAPRPRETSAQASSFDQPRPPVPPQQPGPQQPGPQPGPAQSPGGPRQHPGWPQAFGGAFGGPPAPYAGTTGWPQPMYGALRSGARRPAAVTVAAWLTWVFGALTALLFGLMVLSLLVQRDQLLEEVQRNPRLADQGLSAQQWLSVLWVVSAVGIFWCLTAMVLAALAYHRVRAGQVGLAISAALAGALGLVSLIGIVNGLAAFATVVLLLRGSTNRWFAGEDPRGSGGGPGSGYGAGSGYGGGSTYGGPPAREPAEQPAEEPREPWTRPDAQQPPPGKPPVW